MSRHLVRRGGEDLARELRCRQPSTGTVKRP